MGNTVRQTSPDKVRGKKVRYQRGDCFSVQCPDGKFLAAFISLKFNKYYDVVLMHYHSEEPPNIHNFVNGRFFGTRFGSIEETSYAVAGQMMECAYADNAREIEKVGNVLLIGNIGNAEQSYSDTIAGLLAYYSEELPVRMEKTSNAEKCPEIGFVSRHLIGFKNIIAQ
jgi:hypothetical protein